MTTPVSCEEVIEKLFEFLDRELDEAAQCEIERHLETCRGCFSRVTFERKLRARVAQVTDVEAPDTLRRRVRELAGRY